MSFVVLIVAEDFVTMSDSKATCMALGHCQKWIPVTVPKHKTCLWADIFSRNNT
jgi:hypothetical protein